MSVAASDSGPNASDPGAEAILLADEEATAALGARIGQELEPGDLVALHGEIGAGKTSLARAVLRARLGDPGLEVPSPTFTLVQSYDAPNGSVVHVDLYRLDREEDLVELGYEEWRDNAAILVEWPERAPTLLDRPRLDVALSVDPETGGRRAILSGESALLERLRRRRALDRLLSAAGWAEARRLPMSGDASSRLYERLVQPSGKRGVLMIAPQRPDGPPVRRGRPYSQIAHLAESVHAFAAVDRGLLAQGFSAPRIVAEDLDSGLLLLEDLGTLPVVDEAGPIVERYAEATRLLAALHGKTLPGELPVGPERRHVLPPYDIEALLIEVELLIDWYCPEIVGTQPSGSVRAEFLHAWREALVPIIAGPQTWTLRDYHSPNLIWLPNRSGLARVGLVDFQDAVLGSPAYDVASLLQDARVTVPPELELKLLGIYAAARRAADPAFDMAAFASAYAIVAAQRATKILGIFARLNRRDGKPQYLDHLPRIRTSLLRNLDHPALARVKGWYQAQVPQLFPSTVAAEPGPEPEENKESAPRPAMIAMVLAAGLGQRMRPITDTCPKPLVPVGGRALIDHALARLREAGIAQAVVNVHHLADLIETHLASVDGLDVTVSDERDALLETGGGVKRALPLLGPEFLVMNSDSLWTESGPRNVGRLLAGWDPDRMDALLLLADRESLGYDGSGDFDLDAEGRLSRRQPGGVAPAVYAGVAILKAASFADTPDGAFSLNLVFDRAIAADRLYGLRLDGEWLHVGTPDAIRAAEERLAASG